MKSCSLKIYLVDAASKRKRKPGEKAITIRLGTISFTGEALVEFLSTENSFAAAGTYNFGKDPDDTRPQKPPKGNLLLCRGPRGARRELDRTFVIHAAKLTLVEMKLASSTSSRRKSMAVVPDVGADNSFSIDSGVVLRDQFCFFFNAYFNDEFIGRGPDCVVNEGIDPFWDDAWFQLPVNGQPLKECSIKLELMMYKIIPDSLEGSSVIGSEGQGSSSLKKGSSSMNIGNEMLRPGEGLPFLVAVATLVGNNLKAVVGSKLSNRTETELSPAPASTAKSKKSSKPSAYGEPLVTHKLEHGLLLVGSPGTAVASPLDLVNKEKKALSEKYDEYAAAIDITQEQEQPNEDEEEPIPAQQSKSDEHEPESEKVVGNKEGDGNTTVEEIAGVDSSVSPAQDFSKNDADEGIEHISEDLKGVDDSIGSPEAKVEEASQPAGEVSQPTSKEEAADEAKEEVTLS